jgi:hypothetical protein
MGYPMMKNTKLGAAVLAGLMALGAAMYAGAEFVLISRPDYVLTSGDCKLLVQALRERAPGVFHGETPIRGADCSWAAYGIRAVNRTQHGGFVVVAPPRYSLFRTKAVVSIGVGSMMVGSGEDCTFRWSRDRWRRASCVETWVS